MADLDTEVAVVDAPSMTEQLYGGPITPGTPPIETPEGMSSRRDDEPEKPEEEVEVEEAPKEKAKDEPVKPDWDPERQKANIAAANADKRAAKLELELEGMKQAIADQKTAATTQTEQDNAQASQDAMDELRESISGQDELTGADLVKFLDKMKKLQPVITPEKTDLSPITERLDALQAELDADKADRASEASEASLKVILDGFDKEFDGNYRSDVIASVKEQLAGMGYVDGILPHEDHVRLMLRAEYQKMFSEDPKKKGKKAKTKLKVLLDPGNGGVTIPTAAPHGDLKTVLANMKKEGKFG